MATSGYYERTKEAHLLRAKNWYLNNPERRKEIVDKYRFSEKGIKTKWNSTLKRQYGISLDDYLLMIENQNNTCAICKKEETAKLKGIVKKLSVDHDHKTGKVRKLLCDSCNVLLARAKEDPEILSNAITYLKEFSN
jgi:Recombination endonuclease VII